MRFTMWENCYLIGQVATEHSDLSDRFSVGSSLQHRTVPVYNGVGCELLRSLPLQEKCARDNTLAAQPTLEVR